MRRQLTNFDLDTIERKLLVWTIVNRRRVLIFVSIAVLISFLPSIPYINLFISKGLLFFFLSASFIIIFRIGLIKVVYLSVVFFVLSYLALEVGALESAEFLTNFIYGLIFMSMVSSILGRKSGI